MNDLCGLHRVVTARTGVLVPIACAVALASCGSWQRVGTEPEPDPSVVLPRLFDPVATYRRMGLLAADDPVPFTASFWFLADSTPDSTIAVLGIALSNSALTFRRTGDHFEAAYRVQVTVRRDGTPLGNVDEEQVVRVATFAETRRDDGSVVFQQLLRLPPGPILATVSIRDRHRRLSSEVEGSTEVPSFAGRPALSSLIPVRRSLPRGDVTRPPTLVVNPRSATAYGTDTLRFVFEAYGVADGEMAVLTVSDHLENTVWQDTMSLQGLGPVSSARVAIPPDRMPVGELLVVAAVPGAGIDASVKALVTFSDEWAVVNLSEVLSLLRYFGQDRAIRAMLEAPVEQQAALWKDFWRRTDPNPTTAEHESINEYFQRLAEANLQFHEPGTPGWLTDRGEVAVTLGAPDEEFDFSSDLQTREGLRFIRWNYISERLTLDFVDETGFGRFRLTTASRAEYQRVLNRLRRSE